MKFALLCKRKIPAIENKLKEFLADDLIEAIEDNSVLIITNVENLRSMRLENPTHRFEYHIEIKKHEIY